MARVCKSLPHPEQGYPHREHRSSKGRKIKDKWHRDVKNKFKRIEEEKKIFAMDKEIQRAKNI